MLSEILVYKKLYSYFSLYLRKKFLLIVLSTVLLGFFEMVSIGMIIPILLIILDIRPEGFLSQAKINLNLIYFSEINIVPFVVAIFFLLFVIRSVYSIWHSHYQSKYIYEIQKFVASRLYELRGFPFFDKDKKINAEHLVHKIVNETSQLSVHFSWPLSVIFSEFCIVISLLIIMFLFDFLAALIFFGISFAASILFFLFIKKRVRIWGQERLFYEQERSDLVMRGIHDGIQLNLLGVKNFFVKIFDNYNKNISNLLTLQRTFLLTPRVVIEFFSLIAIFVLALVYFYLGREIKLIVASVSLITFLGVRTMPSLNKIAISIQEFRFARPLIESILSEFKHSEINYPKFVTFRNSGPLYIAKGAIIFKEKTKAIDISIENKGSILITGPSGCGKSTLVKSLIGLDDKFNEISFHKDLNETPKIAFLTSSTGLFKLSLIENILLGRDIKSEELLSIIDLCMLRELDLLGEKGRRIVSKDGFEPSSGEKQRLILARALVSKPKMLILDESLSAVDSKMYFSIEKNLLDTFPGLFIHISHHFLEKKNYEYHIDFNNL